MNPANPIAIEVSYATPANDAAGMPLSLCVFADRSHLRATMCEDATAAGFFVLCAGDIRLLLDGDAGPLGDVVLVDCPSAGGAELAALTRLDVRAAHCGAHLIVSTNVASLDDVFACLDQSGAQILVDPGRGDRVVALGSALSRIPNLRLRDLSENDRLLLLRLTEQVGQIAERLERLDGKRLEASLQPSPGESAFRFESPRSSFAGQNKDAGARLVEAGGSHLPDPRLVRKIIRERQFRARFFDGDLFADPAWDMLLDLTAARAEQRQVSVTSLCIASGVPPTTALRWIGQMIEAGLFERVEDSVDRRRAFVALSDKAAEGMARYFAELGSAAKVI